MEYVALGLWVGGLVVLVAAVIPAVFNSFGGQERGGLFLTRAFEGYNRVVIGSIVLLITGATYRTWMAGQGYGSAVVARLEWWLLAVMAAIALLIILVLHPEAAARQAAAFAMTDGEARKAALATFFKIHQPIRWLYIINLLLGVMLIGVKVKLGLTRVEAAE